MDIFLSSYGAVHIYKIWKPVSIIKKKEKRKKEKNNKHTNQQTDIIKNIDFNIIINSLRFFISFFWEFTSVYLINEQNLLHNAVTFCHKNEYFKLTDEFVNFEINTFKTIFFYCFFL